MPDIRMNGSFRCVKASLIVILAIGMIFLAVLLVLATIQLGNIDSAKGSSGSRSLVILLVIMLTISLLFQLIGFFGVIKENVWLMLTYVVILIIVTIVNLFSDVTIFALVINVTIIALSCAFISMLRKNEHELA